MPEQSTTPSNSETPNPQPQSAQTSQPSEIDITALKAKEMELTEREIALLDLGVRLEAQEALVKQETAKLSEAQAAHTARVKSLDDDLEELRVIMNKAHAVALMFHGIPPKVQPERLTAEIAELQKSMKDVDLLLSIDIRCSSKTESFFTLHHNHVVPYFTEQSMIPESRKNFESLVYGQIYRPVLNRVNAYLQGFVTNSNPLPNSPPLTQSDAQPTVPEAGLSPHVGDS